MKVDQVGLLFLNLYLTFLKKKRTCISVIPELNIIVKNAVVITVIYLKMVQNLQENVIATMACA
jgi:hypothetical protein